MRALRPPNTTIGQAIGSCNVCSVWFARCVSICLLKHNRCAGERAQCITRHYLLIQIETNIMCGVLCVCVYKHVSLISANCMLRLQNNSQCVRAQLAHICTHCCITSRFTLLFLFYSLVLSFSRTHTSQLLSELYTLNVLFDCFKMHGMPNISSNMAKKKEMMMKMGIP